MRNFLNYLLEKKKNISNAVFVVIFLWIYIYFNTFYVTVRFDELGPVSKNMSVYYNGFKVAKIVKIDPDKDFRHTLVRVNFLTNTLKLPRNTTVQLKSFPNGELYLELVYPPCPSLIAMKRGELLEGTTPYSLEQFMLGQNISGVSDLVSIHVIKALDAMGVANMEMENFFRNTSKVIVGNRESIDASFQNTEAMTKSLAQTAENLNQAASKLNKSIDSQALRESTYNVKDSTSNIKESTQNIKEMTENLSKATQDLDKTMKKIDETVSHANSAAANVNCMTGGLHNTLSKRFGGMRVIFGKPVSPKD